ncbi:MAG: ribonuclease Y, partial [Parcubacteria group bacterium]|nr:ribonuclease Y [Parcubacteria group bacterium]
MESLVPILVGVFGAGLVAGYIARWMLAQRQLDSTESKIAKRTEQAKVEAKELILQAKDQAVSILEEAKREEKGRLQQIVKTEERLNKKDDQIEKKTNELDLATSDLRAKAEEVKRMKGEVEALRQKEVEHLERVAQLSRDAAREELFQKIEESYKTDVLDRVKKLEAYGNDVVEKKAQDMIAWAVMRYAAPQVSEITTTIVPLPSDDMKGRIIGREGRNIKALERATGVEIIVDDTPESIVISGFDPVRRYIAKLALERLITDGRIQPARIEETVAWAKEEVNAKIKEAGEKAAYETGIVGLDPRLIYLLGRLHFRTSFGQNALLHSLEVAFVAEALAHQLGVDPILTKKAGLLHDIGKAVDHEIEGGHPHIGYEIMKKFGLPEEIAYPAIGHHEDHPKSLYGVIVKAADAISASRPGARRDTAENYIKRLE